MNDYRSLLENQIVMSARERLVIEGDFIAYMGLGGARLDVCGRYGV